MGVIGKPHGVRGLLRVHAYTEEPGALTRYAPLSDETGRKFDLEWVAENIAQLSEITATGRRRITDRTEAERLTNTELFAPRSALPAAEAEEFYLADLVGLSARNATGVELGKITAVHDYGGGVSLEINGATPLIIPFTRQAVPVIDIAGGHIVIDAPADTSWGLAP